MQLSANTFAWPHHHVEDARRNTCVANGLRQQHRRERRVRRRLQYDRVTRNECGANWSAHQGEWEVEWADHGPHAVRLQNGGRFDLCITKVPHGVDVALVALNLTRVDAEEVGRLFDVTERLEAILSYFNREECRVEELSLTDQLGRRADQRDTLLPWSLRPGWVRRLRRSDRRLCGAAVTLTKGADDAAIDWRLLYKGVARGGPGAIDEVAMCAAHECASLRQAGLVPNMDLLVGVVQGGVRDLQLLSHGSILTCAAHMRCAIAQSLPRGGGPARGAAPLEREVVKVGGVAGGPLNRSEDRLRSFGIKFHLGAAPLAVHVPMGDHLL